MRKSAAAAVASAVLLVLGASGCSSTEVDSNGRWVGGAKVMTSWADSTVPAGWHRVGQSVKYGNIIDDFGKDTHRDETTFTAHYREVSKKQFAAFGSGPLQLGKKLECEPADPDLNTPRAAQGITSCYLSMYQGQPPLPHEFDLFATWTDYSDGTTKVDLYLTNDPH
ncbi:MAG: hypothetical protein ACJ72D_08460 [Marmoricola sp.]